MKDPGALVRKWYEGERLSRRERRDLPLAFAWLQLSELEHICGRERDGAEVFEDPVEAFRNGQG